METDYIVVGGGSAGCLLANRLSEDPRKRVVLLEAGGGNRSPWVKIPVGYLYSLAHPERDWGYETVAEPGLNDRALAYARGRGLGGSSAINGMIYIRGHASDYDGWRQAGCIGWGWDDVLPYFRQHEKHHGGSSDHHGGDGELYVSKPRVQWPILDDVLTAAQEAGIPRISDFNTGENFGGGKFDVTQRAGFRWSSADAFLAPARNRSNLTIITGADVKCLKIKDGSVLGVDFAKGHKSRSVTARIETVLCAGAIGSPLLLHYSGIGPGSWLRKAGIDPLVHRNEIGRNLQDHIQLRQVFALEGAKTLNRRLQNWVGKAGIALEYLFTRSGPMSMTPSQIGLFAKSRPDCIAPDIQYHVAPLSMASIGSSADPFDAITISGCALRPESRGSVRPSPSRGAPHPEIVLNALTADADKQLAIQTIRIARHIFAQRSFGKYNPTEVRPGSDLQTEEELLAAAGQIATTIYHPVGTCRMGADANAVVDPRLRVLGVGRLRIADASIMPSIPSGNTNAPTMMIAEKAAAMIREDSK